MEQSIRGNPIRTQTKACVTKAGLASHPLADGACCASGAGEAWVNCCATMSPPCLSFPIYKMTPEAAPFCRGEFVTCEPQAPQHTLCDTPKLSKPQFPTF